MVNEVKSFYYVHESSFHHRDQYSTHRTYISANGLIKTEFARDSSMFDTNEKLPTNVIYKYKVDPLKIKNVFTKYDFKNFKADESSVDDGNLFFMKIIYTDDSTYKIEGSISPVGSTDELKKDILNLVDYKEMPSLL